MATVSRPRTMNAATSTMPTQVKIEKEKKAKKDKVIKEQKDKKDKKDKADKKARRIRSRRLQFRLLQLIPSSTMSSDLRQAGGGDCRLWRHRMAKYSVYSFYGSRNTTDRS